LQIRLQQRAARQWHRLPNGAGRSRRSPVTRGRRTSCEARWSTHKMSPADAGQYGSVTVSRTAAKRGQRHPKAGLYPSLSLPPNAGWPGRLQECLPGSGWPSWWCRLLPPTGSLGPPPYQVILVAELACSVARATYNLKAFRDSPAAEGSNLWHRLRFQSAGGIGFAGVAQW